jgi:hypothetical protein
MVAVRIGRRVIPESDTESGGVALDAGGRTKKRLNVSIT